MTSTNEPAGVWVRVSTGGQDEAQQVPSIMSHCDQHDYTIARKYELNDKSASKGEQQEKLDEMLADMRDGTIKVLVCWRSNRLERRGPEAVFKLKRQVTDAGGRIEVTTEPLFSSIDLSGEAMTALNAVIDSQFSAKLSEDTLRVITSIKASGHVWNGNVGWGYEIVGAKYKHTIEPTDECREYVPQIFQRCIKRHSLRQIAEWLDSEGVRTKRGGKWNEGSVRWIIRNRMYAGRLLDGDGNTVVECPAVVLPAIWDRANEALRSHPKRGPRKNPPMLANLRCARCADKGIDSPMFRIPAGKKKVLKYRCYGRGPQRKGCGNMISLEGLDIRIIVHMLAGDDLHWIREWVEGKNYEDAISNVKQDIRELYEAERFSEVDPLQAKLAKLRKQQENATKGHYEKFYVRRSDGSLIAEGAHLNYLDDLLSEGEYFFGLDDTGRREYLATRDIRAEKIQDGIRLIIDGEEIEANPYEIALLNIVGTDVSRVMLETRIPNATEWQALLRGEMIPGAEETIRSYVTRRYESNGDETNE